jgi:hypothetical protein
MQITFAVLGFLCFHMNFWIYLSISVKNVIRILMGFHLQGFTDFTVEIFHILS